MGVKGGRHWVACVPTHPYMAVAQPVDSPSLPGAPHAPPLAQATHLPRLPRRSSRGFSFILKHPPSVPVTCSAQMYEPCTARFTCLLMYLNLKHHSRQGC